MRVFKKVVAAVAAATMAIGMMASMVSAADAETITHEFTIDVNKDEAAGKWTIDLTDYEKAVITIDFTDTWGGGGMGFVTSETGEWANCNDYGNENLEDEYVINAEDILADEEGKKTFQIQCWWVNEEKGYTVSVQLVPAEEEAPAEDDIATGDAANMGLWIAFAAIALVGVGASVVLKKKEA